VTPGRISIDSQPPNLAACGSGLAQIAPRQHCFPLRVVLAAQYHAVRASAPREFSEHVDDGEEVNDSRDDHRLLDPASDGYGHRLASVPVEDDAPADVANLIIGEPKYTSAEVAELSGMSEDEAERLWIELGFAPIDPDHRHFTDADVDVLRTLADQQQTWPIDPDILTSMTRVLGQALSRVAYAQVENLDTHPVDDEAAGLPGSTGRHEFDSIPLIANRLFDGSFDRFLSYAWRRHLAEAVRRKLEPHDEDQIVGFADLVGYSSLTNRIEPQALPDLISQFEQLAYRSVSQTGGRVIKLIGDAVMFTAPDPVAAAIAGLGMRTSKLENVTLPKVRVGIAMGPVIGIEGDLFGDTVNRASRLSDVALPGTVLVDDALGRALDGRDDVLARPVRPRKLKGLGYVRAWVLRPVDTGVD
jgi:adenylate cyclase